MQRIPNDYNWRQSEEKPTILCKTFCAKFGVRNTFYGFLILCLSLVFQFFVINTDISDIVMKLLCSDGLDVLFIITAKVVPSMCVTVLHYCPYACHVFFHKQIPVISLLSCQIGLANYTENQSRRRIWLLGELSVEHVNSRELCYNLFCNKIATCKKIFPKTFALNQAIIVK